MATPYYDRFERDRTVHSKSIGIRPRRIAVFILAALAAAAFSACGSNDGPALAGPECSGACSCSGNTCSCTSGGMCTLGTSSTTLAADAGRDGGRALQTTAPPNDVTYHCDSKNSCDLTCGTGCTNTCNGQSVCAGSCGSNCTSQCGGTSQCTLTTGTNSAVTCDGGSQCAVTLDAGSTLTCQGNSTCTIQCPAGGCTADCTGSAGCTVDCGPGSTPCHIKCNGRKTTDCAPGTRCDGVCR